MTSTALRTGVASTAPAPRPRRANVIGAVALALGVASLGTWVALDRTVGRNAPAANMYDGVPLWPPLTFPGAEPFGISGLEQQPARERQAWKRRFGLDRPRSIVERPLTGPGGQLDEHRNVVQR